MINGSYTYKRYMRDGSVKEVTAVIRSRSASRKNKKTKGKNGKESASS